MSLAVRIGPVSSEGQLEGVEWIVVHARDDGDPALSVGRVSGGYVLRSHDVGDFWLAPDGSTIEARPYAATSPTLLDEALVQQILPVVHQLAHAPALHASALVTPWGMAAFAGVSHAGKSTMAALLSATWPLAADDFVPVRIEGDAAVAYPSTSWIRLREPSARELGVAGPVRGGKRVLEPNATTEPGRLVRIYLLGPDAEAVRVSPLSRRDAVLALAAHLHRVDPKSQPLLRAELEFLEALATRVPVRRLAYPRRFDVGPAIVQAVTEDLTALASEAAR